VPPDTAAPIKILHVVVPTEVGGMQRVVATLATGLHQRGHRVAVAGVMPAADGGTEAPLLTSLRSVGVAVHAVAVPGRAYRRERTAMAELCRSFAPDVVHTHGYRPDVVDGPVARRLGLPVVTTVHGFTGGDWKNRVYERLQVRAFRRFDAVVAVSRPLANLLEAKGTPRQRIHVVPNAWAPQASGAGRAEARQALGAREDRCLIGWVGRFGREKGPDVLVRTMALLEDTNLVAAMVGDGPERSGCRALAARLGLDERIAWPGAVPDAGRLFAAFDVFVLSSRTEGTPIVLFEAIAAGVPVVASRVGGVPDVVGDHEALLVPADDPAALAAALRAVVADPDAARTRADAARRRLAGSFALDPWLDRYESVYAAARAAAASRR
jgi:glycosyltransferase involved in cell wall biosynthesis